MPKALGEPLALVQQGEAEVGRKWPWLGSSPAEVRARSPGKEGSLSGEEGPFSSSHYAAQWASLMEKLPTGPNGNNPK